VAGHEPTATVSKPSAIHRGPSARDREPPVTASGAIRGGSGPSAAVSDRIVFPGTAGVPAGMEEIGPKAQAFVVDAYPSPSDP
jgi:hypothetical protein